MSRLLFAAARGARLQTHTFGNWETCSIGDAFSDNVWNLGQRIYPDDEHLQYGPISTALREAAERPYPIIGAHGPYYGYAVSGAITDGIGWTNTYYFSHPQEGCDKDLQRSLFLLFLSETLADEGL